MGTLFKARELPECAELYAWSDEQASWVRLSDGRRWKLDDDPGRYGVLVRFWGAPHPCLGGSRHDDRVFCRLRPGHRVPWERPDDLAFLELVA